MDNKQMTNLNPAVLSYKDYGGDIPPTQKQQYKDELLIQIEENKGIFRYIYI